MSTSREQHSMGHLEYHNVICLPLFSCVWIIDSARASALGYQKLPLIKMPEKPYLDPPSLDEESKDVWFPYPSQSDGVPAHLVHLLNALADLNKVTYDLCVSVFSTN